MKLFIALMFICINTYAICVHETTVSGYQLQDLKPNIKAMEDTGSGVYQEIKQVKGLQLYKVQLIQEKGIDFETYNRKHIEYYRYQNIIDFLDQTTPKWESLGYKVTIIGQSLAGRNLYSVKPKNFDPNKQTIVMFGRHHGDEGTANWIIEGFIDEFLKAGENFHKKYQILLYPMINPDGAESMSRYNKNGRDLNRSWSFNLNDNYDEARIIHQNLKPYMIHKRTMPIVLDMHGSFTSDFIYRVKKNYKGREFFNHQQQFIDTLASLDSWQDGNSNLSNGHPKMARLVMIDSYNLNALTHETPRDIKLRNSKKRSKQDLFKQGIGLFQAIGQLY